MNELGESDETPLQKQKKELFPLQKFYIDSYSSAS